MAPLLAFPFFSRAFSSFRSKCVQKRNFQSLPSIKQTQNTQSNDFKYENLYKRIGFKKSKDEQRLVYPSNNQTEQDIEFEKEWPEKKMLNYLKDRDPKQLIFLSLLKLNDFNKRPKDCDKLRSAYNLDTGRLIIVGDYFASSKEERENNVDLKRALQIKQELLKEKGDAAGPFTVYIFTHGPNKEGKYPSGGNIPSVSDILYVGCTDSPEKRMKEHMNEKFSKYYPAGTKLNFYKIVSLSKRHAASLEQIIILFNLYRKDIPGGNARFDEDNIYDNAAHDNTNYFAENWHESMTYQILIACDFLEQTFSRRPDETPEVALKPKPKKNNNSRQEEDVSFRSGAEELIRTPKHSVAFTEVVGPTDTVTEKMNVNAPPSHMEDHANDHEDAEQFIERDNLIEEVSHPTAVERIRVKSTIKHNEFTENRKSEAVIVDKTNALAENHPDAADEMEEKPLLHIADDKSNPNFEQLDKWDASEERISEVIKTDMQDSGKPEPSISQSHRAGTDKSFSWKNRSKYVALGAVIGIMVFLLKPWDLINVNFASSEDNKGQEKVSTMKSEATINK